MPYDSTTHDTTVVIVTEAGRRRTLPHRWHGNRSEHVAGLDPDGRIVVDHFDARNAEPAVMGGWVSQPFMFGLTLCCDASDKGAEDGVVCRGCYDDLDTGSYIYRDADGQFPALDPVKVIITLPVVMELSTAARQSEIDCAASVTS